MSKLCFCYCFDDFGTMPFNEFFKFCVDNYGVCINRCNKISVQCLSSFISCVSSKKEKMPDDITRDFPSRCAIRKGEQQNAWSFLLLFCPKNLRLS